MGGPASPGLGVLGMVGLPNFRLYRRVLADLDRPASIGDTVSLRNGLRAFA